MDGQKGEDLGQKGGDFINNYIFQSKHNLILIVNITP